jgi:hypothetical protein
MDMIRDNADADNAAFRRRVLLVLVLVRSSVDVLGLEDPFALLVLVLVPLRSRPSSADDSAPSPPDGGSGSWFNNASACRSSIEVKAAQPQSSWKKRRSTNRSLQRYDIIYSGNR